MEQSEFYYQATKSGTRFRSVEPDPEEVGMEDFRKSEAEAVLAFLGSKNQVLVMGGISATSKTFTLRNLAKDRDLDFVDFHAVGQYTRRADEIGAEAVAKEIMKERTVNGETRKALIMDEGVAGILSDGGSGLRHRMDDVIRKLLEAYPHIVICGGGADFTSEEQTQRIAEALPGNMTVETCPFPFKNTNIRQTADLLQRINLYKRCDERISEVDPSKLIHRDIAQVMAEIYIQYFRMSRILLTSGHSLLGDLDNFEARLYDFKSNVNMGIMPRECWQAAWQIQEQRIRERRDELMAVIERSSARGE